jgi:hypothetical protein
MKWIADLMKKCLPHKMEVMRLVESELKDTFLPVGDQIVNGFGPEVEDTAINLLIVCPEIPGATVANELLHMVPANVKVLFYESIKRSTSVELQTLFMQAGIVPQITPEQGHKVTIKVMNPNAPEPHDELWGRIEDLLKRDGYAKSWEIQVNGARIVYDLKMVQEAQQHHNIRDCTITDQDITDVRILLNSTNSVDEFLAKL